MQHEIVNSVGHVHNECTLGTYWVHQGYSYIPSTPLCKWPMGTAWVGTALVGTCRQHTGYTVGTQWVHIHGCVTVAQ